MPSRKLSVRQFQHCLVEIMEEKHHWAWPMIVGPAISKAQLKIHYQQEYAVYVRDFPVFLARIHGKNPPFAVRRMLAENIYEEDTGKLSVGFSHPDLFLKMMEGLGFQTHDFQNIRLLVGARRYRAWLDKISHDSDWVMGAAVFTIFVEGSVNDRGELTQGVRRKSAKYIQRKLRHHPLVQYHGVPLGAMDLIRAHQMVESGHRHDAYDIVLNYTTSRAHQEKILKVLRKTLQIWMHYRDGVAKACGFMLK